MGARKGSNKPQICKCEFCGQDFHTTHKKKMCDICRPIWISSGKKGCVMLCAIPRHCITCATLFTPSNANWYAKVCSRKCKSRNDVASRNTKAPCRVCGKPNSCSTASGKKFCSIKCKRSVKQASKKLYRRICPICGVKRWDNQDTKKSACDAHKWLAYGIDQHKADAIAHEKECGWCGVLFCRLYGSKSQYCSNQCVDASKRKQKLDMGSGSSRARARRYGVEYEPVNVIKVFERDGWRCQICGRRTPKKLRGRVDCKTAPELDHRVPLSRGGGHTYDNVQCACRDCNGKKSANRCTGQLPLFDVA